MIDIEEMLLEATAFWILGAPLLSGMITIFESAVTDKKLTGIQWALIYAVNAAAIFIINILFVFCLGVISSMVNSINIDGDTHNYSAKTLISVIISEIAIIIVAVVLKRLIKGSLTILPQNERKVNMFGKFIKERREKLGLSCSELARRSGHPVSSIHGIETGENKNPRFRIVIDIAAVLEVNLEEMKSAFEDKK